MMAFWWDLCKSHLSSSDLARSRSLLLPSHWIGLLYLKGEEKRYPISADLCDLFEFLKKSWLPKDGAVEGKDIDAFVEVTGEDSWAATNKSLCHQEHQKGGHACYYLHL